MIDQAVQRAQVYYFFSHALIYPKDNWISDLHLLEINLRNLAVPYSDQGEGIFPKMDLDSLQAEHRDVFGLTGSLLYETELGLPHEFRQSQEMADIAGFYQAFGFRTGSVVRERPDHLATELEFMYLLALKEAYAEQHSLYEMVEICVDAQRKFLQDHLARWIRQFCKSLEVSTGERLGDTGLQSPYIKLTRLLESFVLAETIRLGAEISTQPIGEQKLTPYDPDYTCAGCAIAETNV